jgi:hypothetical protein
MNDRKLTNLLESLKDHPELGGEFDFDKSWSRVASEIGLSETPITPSYTTRDYLEYYMWQLTHAMLKPIAATVAIFVLTISGWVTVANSSTGALPGDRLYPVKLSMEKAQVALAFNDDQRMNLTVEFAGRRLDEMVKLAALSQNADSATIQLAVDRFKSEVVNMQGVLGDGADKGTEIARTVARNVEAYSTTVASPGNELSDENKDEIAVILEETQEQVVEVILTAHEQDQDEATAKDLQTTLDKEIALTESLFGEAAADVIQTAKSLAVEGDYRRALQVLKEFQPEPEEIIQTEE